MGLLLNLIVQTIVWFGFMGVIIFSAAGTLHYAAGWVYLGGDDRHLRRSRDAWGAR
ncbi:MAG TPA: hypothetical protein VFB43_16290 [Terracidiphilus sp.]|nr:hypothetical protein [Terracidiphilus sp.]